MLSDSNTHAQTRLSGALALWPYYFFILCKIQSVLRYIREMPLSFTGEKNNLKVTCACAFLEHCFQGSSHLVSLSSVAVFDANREILCYGFS